MYAGMDESVKNNDRKNRLSFPRNDRSCEFWEKMTFGELGHTTDCWLNYLLRVPDRLLRFQERYVVSAVMLHGTWLLLVNRGNGKYVVSLKIRQKTPQILYLHHKVLVIINIAGDTVHG